MGTSTIGEILSKVGMIDDLQLRSALARQEQWGGRLAMHLVDLGFMDEAAIADAIAKALGIKRVKLSTTPKDSGALLKVDLDVAEQRGIYPCFLQGKTLWLAMADPTDLETMEMVAKRSGCLVRAVVAGEKEIMAAIWRNYRNQEPPPSLLGKENNVANGKSKITAETVTSSSEMQRLQQDLDKTSRVLRGLIQVLVDKQVLSNEEIRVAISRLVGKQ